LSGSEGASLFVLFLVLFLQVINKISCTFV
jgi:hypothetical protein